MIEKIVMLGCSAQLKVIVLNPTYARAFDITKELCDSEQIVLTASLAHQLLGITLDA